MHTLPDLPYEFDALEPTIDAKTMQIHHDLHHGGYVNKLNAAVESHPELQEKSLEDILKNLDVIPDEIRTAVQNNGGGHWNHSFFWKIMKPGGSTPEGEVSDAINESFGSFDAFKEQFSQAAATLFGSGWAWLVKDDSGKLSIIKTVNQDNPISVNMQPVLGLDVWEHAYYLNYQNKRADYINKWFDILNWEEINKNFIK